MVSGYPAGPRLLGNDPAAVLSVWMNGERVGFWQSTRGGEDRFAYADEWFASPALRPISLSLPMLGPGHVEAGPHVETYFDNLLPDRDDVRRALQQSKRAASTRPFDLLAVLGRDCIGAVQLLRFDETPGDVRRIDAEPLDDAMVAAVLRAAPTSQGALGSAGDLRISLAGAQNKTALLQIDGRWYKPLGSTPTTHILKLPMGAVGDVGADFSGSIEVEHLCALLLRELGMPVASTSIARFEDQRALVVERFDRRWIDGQWIARIPQEDFCQVLKFRRDQKYEADGGPGMRDVDRVLRNSANAHQDRLTFMRSQLLFWLFAAIDGHAKNFSLHLRAGGDYVLTPLYDVLSAYPVIGSGPRQFSPYDVKLAMSPPGSNNRHYKLREILPRHWRAACRSLQVPLDPDAYIHQLRAAMPSAMERVAAALPPGFPEPVRDGVFAGIADAFDRWAQLA